MGACLQSHLLRKLRKENQKFKVCLGNLMSSCLKMKIRSKGKSGAIAVWGECSHSMPKASHSVLSLHPSHTHTISGAPKAATQYKRDKETGRSKKKKKKEPLSQALGSGSGSRYPEAAVWPRLSQLLPLKD